MDQRIAWLDDSFVLRVLSAVTENLREELHANEAERSRQMGLLAERDQFTVDQNT
jgi:hypothetical protein